MKLRLNLKAKWYNMIESGMKTEEYREIKPYWNKRLTFWPIFDLKPLTEVEFVYGYTKRTMTFKCEGVHRWCGKEEWGAEPGKVYYVIKIGERIR